MPFKKRRIKKSPNKNDERSLRNQSNAPLLKMIFPEVERLVLDLRFSSRQGDLLQDDHLEYGPSDPIKFTATCPGGCGDGETNLQGKIEAVVRQRQTSGEGRAQCPSPLYSASDLCGCQLECQVQVAYRPE